MAAIKCLHPPRIYPLKYCTHTVSPLKYSQEGESTVSLQYIPDKLEVLMHTSNTRVSHEIWLTEHKIAMKSLRIANPSIDFFHFFCLIRYS